jgi:hypothetical protein
LHARSIMITGVQRQHQTDDGLQSLLANLGVPYPSQCRLATSSANWADPIVRCTSFKRPYRAQSRATA